MSTPQLETPDAAATLRGEISEAIASVLADWQNTENDGRINDSLTDRLLGTISVAVVDSVNSFTDKITADELRRLADELDAVREEMREVDDRTIRSSGLGEGVQRLRARADELAPQAVAS